MNGSLLRAGSPPDADQRRRRALSQATSGLRQGGPQSSFAAAALGRIVRLENPSLGLHNLPERPKATPSPYGRHRPCRQRTSSGAALDLGEHLPQTRRLLPTPGSPTIVTSWQDALLDGALERADEERVLELTADDRRRERTVTSLPKRRARPEAAVEAERPALPLTTTGSSSSKSKTRSVARNVDSETARRSPARLPAGARRC